MGGKARISTALSSIINEHIHGKPFVSLFCGACNVESKINASRKICNDKHEYLIAMWQALQQGYELPESVSEEQYKYIRAHKDDDKALSGFVGFACAFGGDWFHGYASGGKRNCAATGKRHTMKCFKGLRNAEFLCMDYREVPIPEGAVIYVDPPYAGTTGYTVGKFDSAAFWEYMRVLSKEHLVFISEQTAPEDFASVWEKPYRRSITNNINNGFMTVEKLFVHRSRLAEMGCNNGTS